MRQSWILLLTFLLTSSACQHHRVGLGDVHMVTSEADQRAVFVMDPAEVRRQTIVPDRVVCAEPSPDVTKAVSEAFGAGAGLDVNLPPTGTTPEIAAAASGAVSRSRAEAVAQLTQRLATIQLLRDSLYRACEAYANGAINATTYSIFVSRYDDVMITMLLGELAAGNFGGSLAALGMGASGSAEAQAAMGRAREDREEQVEAQKGVEEAQQQVADSEGQGAEAQQEAEEDLALAQARLERATQAAAESSAKALTVLAVQGPVAAPSAPLAEQLKEIQRRYIQNVNADALLVACITAMDRETTGPNGSGSTGLTEFCKTTVPSSDGPIPLLVAVANAQRAIVHQKIERATQDTIIRSKVQAAIDLDRALSAIQQKAGLVPAKGAGAPGGAELANRWVAHGEPLELTASSIPRGVVEVWYRGGAMREWAKSGQPLRETRSGWRIAQFDDLSQFDEPLFVHFQLRLTVDRAIPKNLLPDDARAVYFPADTRRVELVTPTIAFDEHRATQTDLAFRWNALLEHAHPGLLAPQGRTNGRPVLEIRPAGSADDDPVRVELTEWRPAGRAQGKIEAARLTELKQAGSLGPAQQRGADGQGSFTLQLRFAPGPGGALPVDQDLTISQKQGG
jgi:hypothetical protein